MRTFVMTPAKQAALRKATEANTRNWRMTPARRAASRANIQKAWAKNRQVYVRTEKRLMACLENIVAAQAAPRTRASRARSRFNRLRHGLLGKRFEETMRLLGEDAAEYQELLRLLARALLPQDEVEGEMLQRLGHALWQRQRLFKAQARWELDELKSLLLTLAELAEGYGWNSLEVAETRQRAELITGVLKDDRRFQYHAPKLHRAVTRALAALAEYREDENPALVEPPAVIQDILKIS